VQFLGLLLHLILLVSNYLTVVGAMLIIQWSRQWQVNDPIVWVNVRRLNLSWKRDRAYYVGVGARTNAAKRDRYKRVGDWVKSGREIWMPHVCLAENGHISFTDGRHRFAWMRDHGVKSIPVTTQPKDARRISEQFGSRTRQSHLPK